MKTINAELLLFLISTLALVLVASKEEADSCGGHSDNDDTCRNTQGNDEVVHHGQRQIDWVRENGGFVHEAYDIRRENPNDHSSPFGVFAAHDIVQGDLLLDIPRSLLLTSKEPDDDCDTVRNLVEQIHLGEESKWAPYVQYLVAEMKTTLPGVWSDEGKDLLKKVVGETNATEEALLPPSQATFLSNIDCKLFPEDHEDRPWEIFASQVLTSRGWDEVLIPLMDMLNHRNGNRWLNTDSNSVHNAQQSVQLRATQEIAQGSEIYTSYTHCRDCGLRRRDYGTPSILRDYGFVEDYPRTWIFSSQHISFTLDKAYNEDGSIAVDSDGNEEFSMTLTSRPLEHDDYLNVIRFFQQQIQRLKELEETDLNNRSKHNVPQSEFVVIQEYLRALMEAMKVFVTLMPKSDPCLSGKGDVCQVQFRKYDSLANKGIDASEALRPYSCDTDVSMDFSEYDNLETVESKYQTINFFMHPETKDCCFDLDDTYQICSSYRPHYHEMMLTYVARFLPKVKRILFVGGGDSMLLHEALQYPDLELVVGLELDQTVTRKSFKHFGTQPHFDNDKVEWWFGDASKSLLMLPKSYFGTFDIILCDMSETVMSNPVTKGIDILGALSLLLKPDGIFVKNELYLKEMSKLFKHSMQVHFYDNPVICSQCVILGSNAVDFSNSTITDHGVPTKIKPLQNIEDHYNSVHSYLRNPFAQKPCIEEEGAGGEQERSPGIVLIVEAENALGVLEPADITKRDIVPYLVEEGLTVISATTSDIPGKGSIVVVIAQEGYIVVRTKPDSLFCAFDVHLWSAFDRLENVKQALVKAVQSDPKTSSSFRIVAGGLFGVSTWKADERQRGPSLSADCRNGSDVGESENASDCPVDIDSSTVGTILEESLGLSLEPDTTALIMCGAKGTPCESISTVASKFPNVVPLWACQNFDDIKGQAMNHKKLIQQKYECELDLLASIRENTSNQAKAGVIVVDPSASFSMAQLLHKIIAKDLKVDPAMKIKVENIRGILRRGQNEDRIFADNMLVIAPLSDGTDKDAWRRNFVYKMGTLYLQEPIARSSVLFNSTNASVELCIFSSGNLNFLKQLNELADKVSSRTGLINDLRSMEGGHPTYQHNFVPSQFFAPSDYDKRDPFGQWVSQQPWGYQVIFQFEEVKNKKETVGLSIEFVQSSLEDTLSSLEAVVVSAPKQLSVGDGSLFVATFLGGNIVLLWDGRKHLDANLFLYDEDVNFATGFATQMIGSSSNPRLEVVLRDEMPRGFNRVVNFKTDLGEPRSTPPWAVGME